MVQPMSGLCFQLAKFADDADQHHLSYILRMAAQLAHTERVQMPDMRAPMIGSWDWDIASDRVFFNPYAAARFGIDPAAAAKGVSLQEAVKVIHRDDVGRVAAAIERSLRGGGLYNETYRTVVNGCINIISANGGAVLDESGTPIRCFGLLVDAVLDERVISMKHCALN